MAPAWAQCWSANYPRRRQWLEGASLSVSRSWCRVPCAEAIHPQWPRTPQGPTSRSPTTSQRLLWSRLSITMDCTRKLVTNTEHGSNNSGGQLGCPQVFAIFNSADMYQHVQMCPEQRGLGPDRSIAPGFSLQPSPVSQLLTLTQTREFLASSGC